MASKQLIVLFGESLLMDAVEASLRVRADLETVRVPSTMQQVEDHIRSLDPNFLIFDWDAPHSQIVFSYLRDRPGTPLLGLDVNRNDLIAVISLEYPAITINDLANIIKLEIAHSQLRRSTPNDVAQTVARTVGVMVQA